MRLSVFLLAVALGACADVPPQVVGPYETAAQLPSADVQEIRALAATQLAGLHTTGPPSRLTVWRPDCVAVEAPIHDPTSSADHISFIALKRHGHWIAAGGNNERVIVN
jgi:hypothetical protein